MPPTGAGGSGGKLTPLAYSTFGGNASGNQALAAINQIFGAGFVITVPLNFSHMSVWVGVADAVNNYDIGIYNPAGTLLANIGAQHFPSLQQQSFATLQGLLTLQPGSYCFAFTGTAQTMQLGFDSARPSWFLSNNIGTSVAGTLPASITPLTQTLGTTTFFLALF